VDPDNRRPVDYDSRRRALKRIDEMSPPDIWAARESGLPKLWTIRQALKLRKERPEAFDGAHTPLSVRGGHPEHVIAYQRGGEVVTAVPRWLLRLGGDWGDTQLELPEGTFRCVFSGHEHHGMVRVEHLFRDFPLALLARS
jgi:(1->4)-alpha-D-glucan 1-alpha-D-glucosylmutase